MKTKPSHVLLGLFALAAILFAAAAWNAEKDGWGRWLAPIFGGP